MTESEWLACVDPMPMLEFLRGRASERKLRLFAVACCQRVWRVFPRKVRETIRAAERYAEGKATAAKLRDLCAQASHRRHPGGIAGVTFLADLGSQVSDHIRFVQETATYRTSFYVRVGDDGRTAGVILPAQERTIQAGLLRDIFRLMPTERDSVSSWLAWNDGAIRKMAQVIYDDRAFDRLPLLADALEDAGCTDAAILGHCRGGGEHVRGCWVVDLLLGKQ